MDENQIRKAVHQIAGIIVMLSADDDRVSCEDQAKAAASIPALAAEVIGQALVDLHRIADTLEARMPIDRGAKYGQAGGGHGGPAEMDQLK